MTVTNAANANFSKALSSSASGAYSPQEQKMLDTLSGPDRDRMEAQLALQKQQETVAFITNMLKKQNEIAMSVIGNMK